MTEIEFIRHDTGGVNTRIMAKEVKADFRRIEAASLKMKARFCSAEGKRMFIRYFNTMQLAIHFISVISRTRLNHDDVTKAEELIRGQVQSVADRLNQSIDDAEALFRGNGITSVATYDTIPLEIEVGVLSSSSRRYLEVLGKLDQLMPLLQTLEIHEVINAQAVDIERATIKRKVRDVANGARNVAARMRREMNALESRAGGARLASGNGLRRLDSEPMEAEIVPEAHQSVEAGSGAATTDVGFNPSVASAQISGVTTGVA